MTRTVRVGVFRPDDERLRSAVELIEALGATPVADPMLAVRPAGTRPRGDADFVVFTSRTGVRLAEAADWRPDGTAVCAIGEPTAEALRDAGWPVDRIPAEYSSRGLVKVLEAEVDGRRVEVARSDHGSATLLEGLGDAGAYVHETVLYALERPDDAGSSVELAAQGELEVALFTSSLTVEHFMTIAEERGLADRVREALEDGVVGAIGEPTRRTAERVGLSVDVVPEVATFEALATAAVERAAPSYHG